MKGLGKAASCRVFVQSLILPGALHIHPAKHAEPREQGLSPGETAQSEGTAQTPRAEEGRSHPFLALLLQQGFVAARFVHARFFFSS